MGVDPECLAFESVKVTFACPHCGRPNGSPDGRTRVVRCACGQTVAVGSPVPGKSPPGQLRPPPLPTRSTSLRAPAYDPVAAHHGLLIDERQARALAPPRPFLLPEVDDADVQAVEIAPPAARPQETSAQAEPRREDLPRPRLPGPRTATPWRWVRRAVVVLALLAAAGAAAWFLVPRTSLRLPPAVAGLVDRLRGGAGGPGEAEVASALEASAKPFQACVQAAQHGPRRLRLEGRRVTLHVTVTGSGRVTAPRLEEAKLDRSPLGACLKSAARRMVFPPHSGEPVEVRIPLELGGRG